ncbi:hypothetical protein NKH49_34520, partial [Mesorhizobium sp. M1088]|uniref:hypothetical protein n=1 Tax=Mesorhizobium sp. M1088 TaxID=2957056 RepID=UPI00333A49BB
MSHLLANRHAAKERSEGHIHQQREVGGEGDFRPNSKIELFDRDAQRKAAVRVVENVVGLRSDFPVRHCSLAAARQYIMSMEKSQGSASV